MRAGRSLWSLQRPVDSAVVTDVDDDEQTTPQAPVDAPTEVSDAVGPRSSGEESEGDEQAMPDPSPAPRSSADLLAQVASPRREAGPGPSGARSAGRATGTGRPGGRRPDFSGFGRRRSGDSGPDERAVGRSTGHDAGGRHGGYRVRRVRRLLRHVEPWSVLKISLVFYFCVWGLVVISTRMLWSAAENAGTIDKIESFVEDLFTLEMFEFDTSQILRVFTLGGLVLVVGGTGLTVLLVVLFNLISDLMGGVRFTMIEEETAARRWRLRHGDQMGGEPAPGGYDADRGRSDVARGG